MERQMSRMLLENKKPETGKLPDRTRRDFLATLTAGTVALTVPGCAAIGDLDSMPREDDRPNIVLIFADDVGYGDVSIQGCRNYSTPNIDSIARKTTDRLTD